MDARTAEREARIKRLPRWAQDHIRTLCQNLADAKEVQESIADGTSGIFWHLIHERGLLHYLPSYARVRFETAGGAQIDVSFSDEGELRLYGHDDALTLRADSPNVWRVERVTR